MRLHLGLLLFASLCFPACGIILINNNDFVTLSPQERGYFHPFNIANSDKPVSYTDSCVMETINHHNLSELSSKHTALWVHYFVPWCKGVTCEDIAMYQRQARSCGPDVTLVLVALSYQYSSLKRKLSLAGIDRMVYVIDTCYSARTDRAMRQLYAALKKFAPNPRIKDGDDFIIRNDTLVYMKDGRKPDSVFLAVLRKAGEVRLLLRRYGS
jgi:hypothetical protein